MDHLAAVCDHDPCVKTKTGVKSFMKLRLMFVSLIATVFFGWSSVLEAQTEKDFLGGTIPTDVRLPKSQVAGAMAHHPATVMTYVPMSYTTTLDWQYNPDASTGYIKLITPIPDNVQNEFTIRVRIYRYYGTIGLPVDVTAAQPIDIRCD